jgi:glucose-6-phosphate 1-dehydrogenase
MNPHFIKPTAIQKPESLVMVIFGATGDLTYRKLIPAVYALYNQQMLPDHFHILGIGRKEMADEAFHIKMKAGIVEFSEKIHVNNERIDEFIEHLSYYRMDMENQADYLQLAKYLALLQKDNQTESNYLFYLSMPPNLFGPIANNLSKAGLSDATDGYRRLIIEKPFGYDLESGLALNHELHEAFHEDQIYRIDHYLGKETVQNLLVMRFANGIFEPLWNRNYINHIEITSSESIGVEGRGGYYDGSGALRDMLQNHMLQMVGLTAMEPPSSMDAESIRNEIFKVLQSLRPIREKMFLSR